MDSGENRWLHVTPTKLPLLRQGVKEETCVLGVAVASHSQPASARPGAFTRVNPGAVTRVYPGAFTRVSLGAFTGG